ncbi:hypothetical protein TanjilG_24919 [Lupinus angustifolius]|uniref:RING-type domain-containing protein n=1 Tax=Lupinus angustifolius TaxID=3871 RepID=A0A4P1R0I7_LUPAN|nr:hypothetical protein TanjilG_24919 [Lupinus angustifolius]
MLGPGTNLVTTVIGFGMSATFIVYVCTRIICARLRRGAESRIIYEFESRIDVEQPEHHVNESESEPVLLDAIPTLKFNQEAFSSIENIQLSFLPNLLIIENMLLIFSSTEYVNFLLLTDTIFSECIICLADYKEREILRMMPECGHTFHLSCIDVWLRKQPTCPVCRLSLKSSSETKRERDVTLSTNQSFDESHTPEGNEDNEDIQSHVESTTSNSLQATSGEPEARQ